MEDRFSHSQCKLLKEFMLTVNDMTVEQLELHISNMRPDSACQRASIDRLNKLLEEKKEELLTQSIG